MCWILGPLICCRHTAARRPPAPSRACAALAFLAGTSMAFVPGSSLLLRFPATFPFSFLFEIVPSTINGWLEWVAKYPGWKDLVTRRESCVRCVFPCKLVRARREGETGGDARGGRAPFPSAAGTRNRPARTRGWGGGRRTEMGEELGGHRIWGAEKLLTLSFVETRPGGHRPCRRDGDAGSGRRRGGQSRALCTGPANLKQANIFSFSKKRRLFAYVWTVWEIKWWELKSSGYFVRIDEGLSGKYPAFVTKMRMVAWPDTSRTDQAC